MADIAEPLELVVPDDWSGERVDKVLSMWLEVSRSVATTMVPLVRVDGGAVKPSDRVLAGSVVEAPPVPVATAMVPEPIDFGVLYEDESVVVVDKPAGLVVHPGSGRSKGTLAAGLAYRYPELLKVGDDPSRAGLVHRLDKETSGVLLVARTQESFETLTKRLRARQIRRIYLTLAHGILEAPTGTIDAPIGRDPARPMQRAVVHGGKPARSHFEVLEEFPEFDCSLLRVTLETGRTHQIRVHLDAIEHPVVGDSLYSVRPRRVGSPRMFLHAHEIGFRHPLDDRELTFSSPLPPDLEAVLEGLRR